MDKILVCVFLVFVFASSLSFLLLWHVTICITKKYTELIHQLLFSDYLRLIAWITIELPSTQNRRAL